MPPGSQPHTSNPIVPGHHADPEMRFYDGRCWIYATRSFTDYTQQRNLDAFSSKDLRNWERHSAILVANDFPWVTKAVWAPTIHRHRDGCYYLVFASNDITHSGDPGGLEIAVAEHPQGPFRGLLGRPLLNEFVHGAQPIDPHLFEDPDGTVYLFYGGWGHCNAARMNRTMDGFAPWPDGGFFREVTPPGYTEAPCMILHDGTYHFMWSSGNWANASYHVSVATARDPLGPFDAGYPILQSQPGLIEGPGHHSCARHEDGTWLIAYHRRVMGDPDPGARELCLGRMEFEGDRLLPVLP